MNRYKYLINNIIAIRYSTKASENIKIWSNFTATRRTNGAILKFRIQDLPKDRIEEVTDFYMKYFPKEETYLKASGIYKNETAMAELRSLVKFVLHESKTHTDVCYVDDGTESPAIAGVSIMVLRDKDEEDIKELLKKSVTSKENLKLFEIIHGMNIRFDVFKTCDDIQKYYDGTGVLVHPDYRGLGIAKEFLTTRRLVCQAEGIPVTEAWMTAIGSQKAAARAGWQTAVEASSKDLEQQFNVPFEGAPVLKAMYVRIK